MNISIQNKISELMLSDNSLTYNKEELMKNYYPDVTEPQAIARDLCGMSGEQLALAFMLAGTRIDEFLHNISFNGERSNPLIMRAIQIHLQNQQ